MTTAIQKYEGDMPLAQLGQVFAASGYFADARDAAQAIVKIQAGKELGFGPVASMTGIFIVKNRVTMSASIMAAAIKRSKPYDYRIKELTDQSCTLVFSQDGQVVGESSFSMTDARKAGLDKGDNWKGYPRNMLFARALSNGAKWYCPDVFCGPVYTPDELGVQVDGETGEPLNVIEVAPLPAEKPAQQKPMPAVDKALAEVEQRISNPPPAKARADLTKLKSLIEAHNLTEEIQARWCGYFKVASLNDLAQEEVDAIIRKIESRIKGEQQ